MAAAAAAPEAPVASRRLTSILFGDLVGFTTLSESRDTEDVRELLARYFDESRLIVERYGGTIEKFIGDAVMAVWGVPVSQEDDAERAVRAGLELVAAVAEFGEEVGAPELAMRVGVVTGEVAVTVGATQQGMVAGDPVNTAARVQSAASPGQVWVDETTRLLTTAAISYVDVGSHALKGKADPMPLWAVRAVVAAVGGAQRADGLEAPLVGRDRELRLVKELFHRTEESGRPSMLVIEGEAGVGKSRLGWEFEKYVDGLTTTVRWHSGRCVAYGEGVAYFAIAEAVRGRLRALAEDPDTADDEEVAAQLERGLGRYVAEGDREWLRPRLGALLGLGSVGTFGREDLFTAWTVWFESVAEDETLTLVIDDGQHADEGTLMFLEHLLTQARFACFLLLLTRSGLIASRPTLITRPGASVVHLDTLSQVDMATMFEGLVPGLPAAARAQLVERAEGVPLFAVETVRSLIDRDLVIPRGGEYVLAPGTELRAEEMPAPASLHALVAARLDTLSDQQRQVVDRASVLGMTFTPDALAVICPDVELSTVLAELVHLQLVSLETSRISAEYGHYRFVQSVVRQVAYGTLSRRDRKEIHLAVVRTLESTGADGDEVAAIRAQHYLDALDAVPDADDATELKGRALDNLRRASRRARALGSPAEASRHLRSALAIAADPRTRAEVGCELAEAEMWAGEYDGSIEHAAAAQAIFEELGDRLAAAYVVGIRAVSVANGIGNNEAAQELAEPWWEEVKDDPGADPLTLLIVSRPVLIARARLKRDIREISERRLLLAEQIGSKELVEVFSHLSVHYGAIGAPTMANVLLEASADLARGQQDLPNLCLTLINLAAQRLPVDLAASNGHAREALAASERSGVLYQQRLAWANHTICSWYLGTWDDLDAAAEREAHRPDHIDETGLAMLAMRALSRGDDWDPRVVPDQSDVDDGTVRGWWAFVEFAQLQITEEPERALARGLEAVRYIHRESGVFDDLAALWGPVALLALEQGAHDAVDDLIKLVEDSAGRSPTGLLAHLALVRGLVAAGNGAHQDAEAYLREALEAYTAWGSVPFQARARDHLGRLLVVMGRADEGRALLDQARATYEQLGARRWLAALDGSAADSVRIRRVPASETADSN